MERVVVWKHTLEGLVNDLNKASVMCGALQSRAEDAAMALDDVRAGCMLRKVETGSPIDTETIYDIGNILDLLSDKLEHKASALEYVIDEAVPVPAQAPFTPQKVVIPEDMDVSCFDDLTDDDLLQEARAKEEAIAAAEFDKALIIEILTRRLRHSRQSAEGQRAEESESLEEPVPALAVGA